MKIYKTFHAYQEYLNTFYFKYPYLRQAFFNEQKKALIYDAFPWIFSWETNNHDSSVEIFETIHNCEFLQKAWNKNKEYGFEWQLNIIFDQIKVFQPDICVLYPPHIFSPNVINYIRQLVKKDILICGYDGMDRKNYELYEPFNLVITCSDYISDFYKKHDKNTYTLPFAFDESILKRIDIASNPKYQIGFSGSIYQDVHNNRYSLLKFIQKRINVEIRSDFGQNNDYRLISKNQLKRLILRHEVDDYFGLWKIQKNNQGPVYGLEMYQFLHDSKISLNMHGDNIQFAANVRMYEITGIGSLMLTDYKENIAAIFEPDKEIITYKSFDEALDKSVFYLKKKNEKIRKKIALAGQKHTLSEYTYEKTISKIIQELKKQIGYV